MKIRNRKEFHLIVNNALSTKMIEKKENKVFYETIFFNKENEYTYKLKWAYLINLEGERFIWYDENPVRVKLSLTGEWLTFKELKQLQESRSMNKYNISLNELVLHNVTPYIEKESSVTMWRKGLKTVSSYLIENKKVLFITNKSFERVRNELIIVTSGKSYSAFYDNKANEDQLRDLQEAIQVSLSDNLVFHYLKDKETMVSLVNKYSDEVDLIVIGNILLDETNVLEVNRIHESLSELAQDKNLRVITFNNII